MDQLLIVLKENPDYKVYMIGHRYVALPLPKAAHSSSYSSLLLILCNNILSIQKSIGGALATLFTFFASTPQYLGNFTPYPFTCVSIASPFVGNDDWRRAFMLQGNNLV
jgi:hypothetical protein